MYNPFSLTGKTILVTGASSGIGRAVAIECSRMGARMVISSRASAHLHETMTMLEGDGHLLLHADLTNDTSISDMVNQLPEIDGVVHSAGMSMFKPAIAVKKTDIVQLFDINCFGPMLLTKALIRAKKLKNGSSIVYISSISGNSNIAVALSTYGASKSALTAYMRYAALELSSRQIRCNAILPGRIETAFLKNGIMDEEATQLDQKRYPLGRYGKPEEVADAAVYLLSDATRWMTGTELTIDGGRSLN